MVTKLQRVLWKPNIVDLILIISLLYIVLNYMHTKSIKLEYERLIDDGTLINDFPFLMKEYITKIDEIGGKNFLKLEKYLMRNDPDLFKNIDIVNNRRSSFPYISGDSYRAFADKIYDETTFEKKYGFDRILNITKNDIVFVKTDLLKYFNRTFYKVSEPFILVTTNSADSAPQGFENILNSPFLIAWFAQNAEYLHPKLHALPEGLPNRYWEHGNLEKITANAAFQKPFKDRKYLVNAVFNVGTNSRKRAPVLRHIKRIKGSYVAYPVLYDVYLKELGETKFVACPAGKGLDTHRLWESFILGAVPIVESSILDQIYGNSKFVLLTRNITDVSEKQLKQFQRETHDIFPDFIFVKYWYDKMQALKIK
ncbi:hypothetical protein ROZALSC1DRAFT_26557 [Rozella allomycis CSF55]|uniref:Exostosin GT47 domain-containing protein n=1 Tax=Rozella allomycis (strain CSF55) TaxID=988480 RepID=A0A075AQJ2_ROZAC|nr:hypothetical protein O9G_005464 [Rozella allomycis CSF55]RKP22084.1 hypothetical protein ROZALSC1DRAFT_26557 [Rozella allomycis CSF55]|eukprot:EPZ30862.1 hypothetical protein O9G_005464 [Rozella allomycis CSF55]